jgi:hypothetical protein
MQSTDNHAEEKKIYLIFQDEGRPIKYMQANVTAATTVKDVKHQIFIEWSIPEKYLKMLVRNL